MCGPMPCFFSTSFPCVCVFRSRNFVSKEERAASIELMICVVVMLDRGLLRRYVFTNVWAYLV